MRRFGWLALAAVVLAGCQVGVPPDPNDPKTAGILKPEVLQRNLKGASDAFLTRRDAGEIDDAEYRRLMRTYANDLLNQVPIDQVPPQDAWRYAEVFITAERWQDAKNLLETAVKAAKNDDRRVNDSLRLARTLANLNQIDEAIKTARSTYDAPPKETAPILTAVLLEIVPAAEPKATAAQKVELAKLLEEATAIHMKTIVDPELEPGKAFLAARPIHIRNAWGKVVELLVNADRRDEARKAAERGQEMLRGMANL